MSDPGSRGSDKEGLLQRCLHVLGCNARANAVRRIKIDLHNFLHLLSLDLLMHPQYQYLCLPADFCFSYIIQGIALQRFGWHTKPY